MITNLVELSAFLQAEKINIKNYIALDIPSFPQVAFALEVENSKEFEMWNLFHQKKYKTQLSPVLYLSWPEIKNSWQQQIESDDIFSRFPFENEANSQKENLSPAAIIEASKTASLENLLNQHNKSYSDFIFTDEEINYQLAEITNQYGFAPKLEEVKTLISQKTIKSYFDLQQYLFDWELKNYPEKASQPDMKNSYLDWFNPEGETQALLLLPTLNSWEALAFISWFGAESISSEVAIAMLADWNKNFGAELVAHYGTMLHLIVYDKPQTLQQAFELAKQQEAFAPCTTALPGVNLRDHARCLLALDKWFLHERP